MEKAILVTAHSDSRGRWSARDRADELRELAVSAGVQVAGEMIANIKAPHSATFIGAGKVGEVQTLAAAEDARVVIFNNDLSGTQQKNIEKAVGVRTIDRTQLILDIFARRARSNEGKLQVELAQLLYLMPRLTGKGVELSRLGGGIGTRGPGEQKLEVDRRVIRTRIDRLRKELTEMRSRRSMMRDNRSRIPLFTAAIVGYTNAGKSTLLNALTAAQVVTADKLFATLDPTARALVLPNKQKVLLVDTVGFLHDLPHHLIEAFKATLEEVADADLLLHVLDAGHPRAREKSDAVYRVLDEIGVKGRPVITVLNKADLVKDPAVIEGLGSDCRDAVAVSALKRQGLDALTGKIALHAKALMVQATFTFSAGNARVLSVIHENGRVTRQEYRGDSVFVEAELPIRVKSAIDKMLTA